jgi:hypothetical protein
MEHEFEIDLTDQIKAKKLDDLKYTGTPEVFLKTSRSDFEYMDIDIEPLLNVPPPANSSDYTKRELLEVKSFMEQHHSDEFKANLKEMDKNPAKFIIDSYKELSGKTVPKRALDFITGGDVEVLVMKLKMHYGRPRPYQIAKHYNIDLDYNKTIQHGEANAPSYPSGHTLAAYFAARVLGYIDPIYRDKLIKKAEMVADSRMAEGVHFKSDNNFSFALVDNVMMQAFVEAYEKGRDT